MNKAFLLKASNGAEPPVFVTVAGLRCTRMEVAVSPLEDVATSLSITGEGVFTGKMAETLIRANAISGTVNLYHLSFEDGSKATGRFLITRMEYQGDFNGERQLLLSFENVGPVAMQ